jgi:hypothetical protein
VAEQSPQPSLDWLNADVERVKVLPGPDGLTLERIMVGRYGEVPDHWPHLTDFPRGASPGGPTMFAASYSINDKADLWANNAAALYEQAIRDRWVSATDIPWETLTPLPDEVEAAVCQLCTSLSEDGFAAQQVIGRWLERMAYGFLEVKSFLATQVFDAGRHCEAYRKRALTNGGGLGVQSPGVMHRALTDSLKWTELVGALNLFRTSVTLALLETEALAQTEAEATLYRLTARDLERWLAYGVAHVRYHLEHRPDRRDQLAGGLVRGEAAFAQDTTRDEPLRDALLILLGRGESSRVAHDRLAELRRRQVDRYLDALDRAGLPERRGRSETVLKSVLASPAA